MGAEYFIGGEWVSARVARRRLEAAAAVLERSDVPIERALARWVRAGWEAVASRPKDADQLLRWAERPGVPELADELEPEELEP